MKNIWIINHYASDMYFDEGGRHYYFAKYLKRMGFEPTVFCANSKHNAKSVLYYDFDGIWVEKKNDSTNVPYVFVKARPYDGNGKSRVFNMVDFYRNMIKTGKSYAAQKCKPDVIIASSVHPLTVLAGMKLARFFGVKCICEIRDLWPESIVTYLESYKRNNPVIKLLYMGERYIYKRADSIIFTMAGGYDYISERGWQNDIPRKKVFHINNGVDLEQFDLNREIYTIEDEDLNREDLFKVIYAGSIRKVNNLDRLLDIAKKISNEQIVFLIWGDGDELPRLQKRVLEEQISNVVFKGRVEKKYIPFITSQADINFVHNDESPIFRFGISFNKIFDYLAAGKPIICDFFAKYNPVVSNGAGVYYPSSDPQGIAEGIAGFATMSEEDRKSYRTAARKAAEYYDYKNLTKELLHVIEKTAGLN